MIVLVMNDQTKLKLLCFFACKRPMADGRQTKISDHLAAPMSPSFNVVEVAAGILKNDNIGAGAWG